MNDKETAEISFEAAIKRLEETVKKLERGDIALEESMELFTEGMKLANICSEKISAIEKKIVMLVGDDPEKMNETEFEV